MLLGLKLWSTSTAYIPHARELFTHGIFQYIELFAVPGSFKRHITDWQSIGIPYVLHAPHSLGGMNPSIKADRKKNLLIVSEVDAWMRRLDPQYVIFHPGMAGTLDETEAQFKAFAKEFPVLWKRALVENKPLTGLNGEQCLGSTRIEIEKLIKNANMGFCLDFGHAICAAFSQNADKWEYLLSLSALKPAMFHLSDGHYGREKDEHLNIGAGEYDIAGLLAILTDNSMVSLETNKSSKENLDDFRKDVTALRAYETNQNK